MSAQSLARSYFTIKALVYFVLVAWASNLPADDSVINERLPLTSEQLQNHWKVDCNALLSQVNAAASNHTLMRSIKNDLNQMHSKLQLCSAVHERFRKGDALCNPFKVVLIWYKSMKQNEDKKLIDISINQNGYKTDCY